MGFYVGLVSGGCIGFYNNELLDGPVLARDLLQKGASERILESRNSVSMISAVSPSAGFIWRHDTFQMKIDASFGILPLMAIKNVHKRNVGMISLGLGGMFWKNRIAISGIAGVAWDYMALRVYNNLSL